MSEFANQVISTMYRKKFKLHVGPVSSALEDVVRDLQKSKLSVRIKKCLQTTETMRCTIRNINWLLQYWTDGTYPDPVQDEFGFVLKKSGAVDFLA